MNREVNLLAEDCLKRNKKLYFVSKDTNVIYSINMKIGKLEFIDCIPEESILKKNLCHKILTWNDEMIFIPMNAKKIWRYNLVTKQWHGINLGEYENKRDKFFQAFVYKNDLFMIGCGCPAIFRLNLITEEFLIIKKPFKHLINKKMFVTDIFFRYHFVQKGTKILMASCVDICVMEFDLKIKKVLFYKVGNEKNKYSGIVWDGDNYWLSPRYKTPIVRWDGKNKSKEYNLPNEILENEIGFLGVVATDNGILFYGKKDYSILITEKNDNINMKIIHQTYVFYKREENETIKLLRNGKLVVENNKYKKIFHIIAKKNSLKHFQHKRINEFISSLNPIEETFFLIHMII